MTHSRYSIKCVYCHDFNCAQNCLKAILKGLFPLHGNIKEEFFFSCFLGYVIFKIYSLYMILTYNDICLGDTEHYFHRMVPSLVDANYSIQNGWTMKSYCTAQGTVSNLLGQDTMGYDRRKRTYIYVWQGHFAVQQIFAQHCKSTIRKKCEKVKKYSKKNFFFYYRCFLGSEETKRRLSQSTYRFPGSRRPAW